MENWPEGIVDYIFEVGWWRVSDWSRDSVFSSLSQQVIYICIITLDLLPKKPAANILYPADLEVSCLRTDCAHPLNTKCLSLISAIYIFLIIGFIYLPELYIFPSELYDYLQSKWDCGLTIAKSWASIPDIGPYLNNIDRCLVLLGCVQMVNRLTHFGLHSCDHAGAARDSPSPCTK